jgi:hypothetical protein
MGREGVFSSCTWIASMSACLTTFVVGDPHEVPVVAWDRLPPSEKSRIREQEVWSRKYEPADWGRFKAEPESYRSTFSIGHCGTFRLSRIADARGTRFDICEPGLDAFCVSVMARGASRTTQPGTLKGSPADHTTGLIFPGRPATRLVTSGDSIRLQLWFRVVCCVALLRRCWSNPLTTRWSSCRSIGSRVEDPA